MIRYICKKLLLIFISLLFVITITFFFMKAIPGNPFLKEISIPKEILDNLYVQYGFNQPIYKQYFIYMGHFVSGDFGYSFVYEGRSVKQIILEGFPTSLLLGVQALIFSITIGLFLGTIAAINKGRWQDYLISVFYSIGISLPSFLLATLLQYLFSMKYRIFPTANFDSFAHTILPSFSLSIMPTVFIAKLTRDNMVEILQKDFIKFAIAKGLTPFKLIFSHFLRNSILPVVGYIGPMSINIITGSFVIEKIFGIPGLGGWLISSILARDYPVIMGLSVFISIFLLLMIFIMDILYSIIDPRIEFEKNES